VSRSRRGLALAGIVGWAVLIGSVVCTAQPAIAGTPEGIAAMKRQDYAAAIGEFTSVAETGDAVAAIILGNLYEHGEGAAQDFSKALHWYEIGAPSSPKVADLVGTYYQMGRGTLPNDQMALKWYRIAADGGVANAMNNIGSFYSGGRGGLPQDDHAAFLWYQKAAELNDATAQSNMALAYFGAAMASPPNSRVRETMRRSRRRRTVHLVLASWAI
jgi:TPR repeat protein